MREQPESSSWDQTSSLYLGFGRATRFVTPPVRDPGQAKIYEFPEELALHHWALQGKWHMDSERITAFEKGAALRVRFSAKKVFLVAGPSSKGKVKVKVLLDGKPVKTLTIQRQTVYPVITLEQARQGILEIRALDTGFSAYALTFSN